MSLDTYINDRIGIAISNIKEFDNNINDKNELINFINKILNVNFVLDILKGSVDKTISDNDYNFECDYAKNIFNDIFIYIKSVVLNLNNKNIKISDITNKEKHDELIKTANIFIGILKSNKENNLNIENINEYINNSVLYSKKLYSTWNNNEYKNNGNINEKLKTLYILNSVDEYITNIIKDEKKGLLLYNTINGKNINNFFKFLIEEINKSNNNNGDNSRINILLNEFIYFIDSKQNKYGGTENESESGSENEKYKIPNFETVEISLNCKNEEFEIMANNNYVPYALTDKDSSELIIVTRNSDSYNPLFLFNDTRFHDELGKLIIDDPLLSILHEDEKEDISNKLLQYFSSKYPNYNEIYFNEERRYYTRSEGDKKICFRSFTDLFKLYKLYKYYGIFLNTPEICTFNNKYSKSVSEWVLWLKDQCDYYEKKSLLAYPFVREYINKGCELPDIQFTKNPWVVWNSLISNKVGVSDNTNNNNNNNDNLGGRNFNFNFNFNNNNNNNNNNITNNKYPELCLLDEKYNIYYVVTSILGIIFSKRTFNNLYYNNKISKFKNVIPNVFIKELNNNNNYFGGNIKTNKKYMLYRNIIILGRWYFKDINELSFIEHIKLMSGRWTDINMIFFNFSPTNLSKDVTNIVNSLDVIIKEFGDEDDVLEDFIKTFHLILKTNVESNIQSKLPLNLLNEPSNIIDSYNENLIAFKPFIKLDSSIMEIYNLNEKITDVINSKKDEYINSEYSIESLLKSFDYKNYISYDSPVSKIIDMIYNAASRNLILHNYFPIFDKIYNDYTKSFLPNNDNNDNDININYAINNISTINITISSDNISKFFIYSLSKRLLLDYYLDDKESINYNEIERSLENDQKVISNYINNNNKDFIDPSYNEMNVLIELYNRVSISLDIDMEDKDIINLIKYYLYIRYNGETNIPNKVFDIFETLLVNFIFINKTNNDDNVEIITFINEYIKSDQILYNELYLLDIDTDIDILQTNNYLKIPPMYVINVYYNFYINYIFKKMNTSKNINNLTQNEFIKLLFNGFN